LGSQVLPAIWHPTLNVKKTDSNALPFGVTAQQRRPPHLSAWDTETDNRWGYPHRDGLNRIRGGGSTGCHFMWNQNALNGRRGKSVSVT
jgi:hypothetical protein